MKKDRLNSLIRHYVKSVLSPNQDDIQFVSNIYQSFNDLLGVNNCIQIGSYPRYTSVRPLHDLDILYIIGDWSNINIIPDKTLNDLAQRFRNEYKNPTQYEIKIKVQTHSISFKYLKGNEEVFAVDLVPALRKGVNEFGQNIFYVPEIIKIKRGERRSNYYLEAVKKNIEITWIKTDPLGYIQVASEINKKNADFRKTVKFAKGWKNHCKKINDDFKLKSFHIEQIITLEFKQNSNIEIFDALFKFFTELKEKIKEPYIRDRADNTKFIDEYLNRLTDNQRLIITHAVDSILVSFEEIDENKTIESIINSGYYRRTGANECFLFDQKIPVLLDDNLSIKIDGFIRKYNGFRDYQASLKVSNGIIDTKNNIEFKVINNNTNCDILKWKVKNDNCTNEPRGEISDNRTFHNPERTAYVGNHFVECYAIKNNVCIARDRINVIVRK